LWTTATSTAVPSQSIPFYVWTTGTKCNYVDITVQACVYGDTCSNLYCSARVADFEEVWEDYVNGGADAYKIMVEQIGGRNAGPNNSSISRRSRMRLLASFAYRDTLTSASHWPTGTASTSVTGALHATSPQIIRPYIMEERTVNSWSFQTEFANFNNLEAAGTSFNSLPVEWPKYHTTLQWKSWNFRVPVTHGRTDCLCGHICFRPWTGSLPSENMNILVSTISAYAVQ